MEFQAGPIKKCKELRKMWTQEMLNPVFTVLFSVTSLKRSIGRTCFWCQAVFCH